MKYEYRSDQALLSDRVNRKPKFIHPSCAITCNKYGKKQAHKIKCDKCRDRKICMWEH